MKREQLQPIAVAFAVLILGLAIAGIRLETLIVLPLVLAGPVIIYLMRGMDHESNPADHDDHEHRHHAR